MLGTCPIEKAASEKVHCLVFGVFSFLFPVTQKSVTIFSPLLDAQCIAGDSCIPDSWGERLTYSSSPKPLPSLISCQKISEHLNLDIKYKDRIIPGG